MMPHLHNRSGINAAIHLTQFRRMCWEVELYKDFRFFAKSPLYLSERNAPLCMLQDPIDW